MSTIQISGLRRNLKNIAHNYTDAQVKVREATSNDPWGPSSTLMSEVADLTYNVVAFSEIMQMVWKRLNDHGRNWRHVYKALVLLEYLIKTGNEKVADQCKENIFAITTLKDFQYIEENKDQGLNVREKAKALVALLKDEERLRNERVRALKAKERFAQSISGIGSDSDIGSPTSPMYDSYIPGSYRSEKERDYGSHPEPFNMTASSHSELESARPQTVGEEELQLQLALAMSKEEAEQEEQQRHSDHVRLQMALSQSEEDYHESERLSKKGVSAMNDLLDINFTPSMGASARVPHLSPPGHHGGPQGLDPWGAPSYPPLPKLTVTTPHAMANTDYLSLDVFDSHNVSGASSTYYSPAGELTGLYDLPEPADPWGLPTMGDSTVISGAGARSPKQADPWGAPSILTPPDRSMAPPKQDDPWSPVTSRSPALSRSADPWGAPVSTSPLPVLHNHLPPTSDPWQPAVTQQDPFAPLSTAPINGGLDYDDFTAISVRERRDRNGDGYDQDLLGENSGGELDLGGQRFPQKSRSPATFLGENSSLVNLDNLVSTKPTVYSMGVNPFFASNPNPPNPFQAQQAPKPTMNQMRGSSSMPGGGGGSPWGAAPVATHEGGGMLKPQLAQDHPYLL